MERFQNTGQPDWDWWYENSPSPASPSEKLYWSKLAYNESYWLTARGLL